MDRLPGTDTETTRNRASGGARPGTHISRLRVRYAETDRMGVAYYANYLVWFEVGRSNLMREGGIPYACLEEDGLFLRVAEASCRLLAPARYDEELAILTRLEEVKSRKVVFAYEVKRDGELLASGHTCHIPTDREGKVVALPMELRRTLERYL